MRLELTFLFGLIFIYGSAAFEQYHVQLQFTFPDKDGGNGYQDMQFTPSRNTLQVISNDVEVARFHPNAIGEYLITIPKSESAIYKFHFYSKDLMFMATPLYQLDLSQPVSMTSIPIGSRSTGSSNGISMAIHGDSIDIEINGMVNKIEIVNWGSQMVSVGPSLLESIPFLSTVIGSKLLWIPIGLVLVLALLPQLLALLDPSFKDRIVAAQMENKKSS